MGRTKFLNSSVHNLVVHEGIEILKKKKIPEGRLVHTAHRRNGRHPNVKIRPRMGGAGLEACKILMEKLSYQHRLRFGSPLRKIWWYRFSRECPLLLMLAAVVHTPLVALFTYDTHSQTAHAHTHNLLKCIFGRSWVSAGRMKWPQMSTLSSSFSQTGN